MKALKTLLICLFAVAAALGFAGIAPAETGVTDTEITIGGVVDLSGPIAFMGKGVSRGAGTYFQMINDQGGIHGRKIKYLVEDDGYSPPKSVAAAKKLIERDQVFSMFMVLGSAQTLAMYPILERAGVPLIQPATQNSHIGTPVKKYLFLADPTYVDQAKIGVDYAIGELKLEKPKVGVIYQDDEPGHDYRDGVIAACKQHGLELSADVPYKRGTVDFAAHVAKLKETGAQLVMMWTLIREPAGILKEAQKVEYKPTWITATPSTSDIVLKLAGDASFYGSGYYGTAIVYYPFPDNPAAMEMASVWEKYNDAEPWGFYDWYGWGCAKIMVEGLRLAGPDLTREGLIKGLETMTDFKTDVFGPITFGPDKHNGNNQCTIDAPVAMPGGNHKWFQIGPMRAPSF